MLFLNFLPFSLRINALAHSICTFLCLPYPNVKFKRKNTRSRRWYDKKNPFWLLQKTYMSSIVPHFTSLSWEGFLSFTASQDMKDLLGKIALDHTSSYLSLRHTCILFISTLNCNLSFTTSHTTLDQSAVSILFLISLQVEIHVTFPYLDEIQYIELS